MDWFWLICLLGGILAITAAARNWDWFFAHPKVRFFVNLFGRSGARIIYAVLGGFLLVPSLVNVLLDARQALFGEEPPVVLIKTSYPGENVLVVFDTVALPIEQRVNGVEKMLHMTTQCTEGGACTMRVTFQVGIEPQLALVLVQNRVALAGPMLPQEVRNGDVMVQLEAPEIRPSKVVSIALALRDAEGDEAVLREFAKSVLRRLTDEGAIIVPEPIGDNIKNALDILIDRKMCERLGVALGDVREVIKANRDLADIDRVAKLVVANAAGEQVPLAQFAEVTQVPCPTSIFRVDGHPAQLITGSPPEGKSAAQAASLCAQLAEAAKTDRHETKSFEVINLTAN